MRGPGSLEGGTGELVGAGEEAKEDEEVFLQGGLDGVLEALEEVAEGGKDVASGGERRAEVDGGGEVGVDDAEGAAWELRSERLVMGAAWAGAVPMEEGRLLQMLKASESRREKAWSRFRG